MQYFQVLCDNVHHADRWHLDEPLDASREIVELDLFIMGSKYDGPSPRTISINKKYPGRPIKFTLDLFDVPVVTPEIGDILQEVAGDDIERFPVMVGADYCQLEIVNVTRWLDCIDLKRSYCEVADDDSDNNRVRLYRVVSPLFVDASRSQGRHIFRLRGWPVPLIVSNTVRDRLVGIPNLGVVFQPVS